jgi:hypothetical protein
MSDLDRVNLIGLIIEPMKLIDVTLTNQAAGFYFSLWRYCVATRCITVDTSAYSHA